jgi:murein DD-endopeptidase MepM/ murein hydrolase activator NlpD
VRHDNGLETVYAHLCNIKVKPNQKLFAGEIVGGAGRSGNASGVHLHFETRFKDQAFNPRLIFDFDNCTLLTSSLTLTPESFLLYGKSLRKGAPAPQKSIALPAAKPTTTPVSGQGGNYHRIQKGDTLYNLSKRYGTTVNELRRLNGIGDDNLIKIGESIRIR